MKLSVVILARNEERIIRRCIHSVKEIAQEVIVINDESDDATVKVARAEGARIVNHALTDFAAQRNFAETQTKSDWILHLDADESLSPELIVEIRNLDAECYDAFYLRRRDFFWGDELKYGETARARSAGFIRLYKRGSGMWEGSVHERFITNAQTRQLAEFIDHHPHQALAQFMADVNRYSTLRALELKKAGIRANLAGLTVRPIGKFIYTYFFKLGFLDGAAGFVYAFMMSFHSFLVRAKLYQYTELT